MHINKSRITRVLVIVGTALLAVTAGHAQTASGTLNVSATVTSSLQLLFAKATGGPNLTSNTNGTAILPFGGISAYGTEPSGVTLVNANDTTHGTCTSSSPCFVVSAPVNVVVNQFNGSSTKFTLTAELGTADSANFWAVGSEANALSSSSTTAIVTAGGTYGSTGNLETVYLGVPTSTANSTTISNSISFVVTAN